MPLLYVQRRIAGVEDGSRPLSACALPDGSLGVLCEGLVYPLREGYYIELDKERFYLSESSPLLSIPDALAPAVDKLPRHSWDLTGNTLRICFDGPTHRLSAVVELSTQLELNVVGFGRWMPILTPDQTSVGGEQDMGADPFDWFVEFGGPRIPSRIEIDNLFCEASRRPGEFSLPSDDALALRAEISARDQRLALLQDRIEERNEIYAADASRLSAQVNVMQAALSRYRILFDETEKTRRALGQRLDRLAAQDQNIQSLTQSIPTASASDLELALDNWQQSEVALANAKAELLTASEELEQIKRNLSAVESAHAHTANQAVQLSPGRKKAREKDIEITFVSLLPNLIPIADSIPFLAEHVFNLRPLLVLLKKVNDVNMPELPSKKVHGADGWFECHFSTGQSDDGRLYFCWGGGASGKSARVLISNKRRQVQDIERLAISHATKSSVI